MPIVHPLNLLHASPLFHQVLSFLNDILQDSLRFRVRHTTILLMGIVGLTHTSRISLLGKGRLRPLRGLRLVYLGYWYTVISRKFRLVTASWLIVVLSQLFRVVTHTIKLILLSIQVTRNIIFLHLISFICPVQQYITLIPLFITDNLALTLVETTFFSWSCGLIQDGGCILGVTWSLMGHRYVCLMLGIY